MKAQREGGGIREFNHIEYYIKYRRKLEYKLKKSSDKTLINLFNNQVGNPGWCYARMIYLDCLKNELKKRFDVSSIIINGGCSYSKHIYLEHKKIHIND